MVRPAENKQKRKSTQTAICVFFHAAGVATLTVRELFEFIVDPNITEATLDAALDALMEVASRCGGSVVRLAAIYR